MSNVVSPYTLTSLAAGTTYYLAVTAKNSAGESPLSTVVFAAAAPAPVTPPPAPNGVQSTSAGPLSVAVRWNSSPTSSSYNLYWSTESGFTISNSTRVVNVVSPFTLGSLVGNTTYYLAVTAVNAAGESGLSAIVSAVAGAVPETAPPTPTGVRASPGPLSITVQWDTVSGRARYNLYWSTNPNFTITTSTGIIDAVSPYVLNSLVAGTPYYISVAAKNATGISPLSAPVSAVPSSSGALLPPGSAVGDPIIIEFTVPSSGLIAPDSSLAIRAEFATSYSWTIEPKSISNGQSALGSGGAPGLNSVQTVTGQPLLDLTPLHLPLGSYRVTVIATNAAGRSSQPMSAEVTLVAPDIASARVFPNPWRADQHSGQPVVFDHLAQGSTVKLFTLSSVWLRTLQSTDGTASWDLTNNQGQTVASGIYVYLILDGQGHKLMDQLVVIR